MSPKSLFRSALIAFLLAVLPSLGSSDWLRSSSAAERNVVLFVSDDQGFQAGCYGDPVVRTPGLDALAADGTLFNYAFCTTPSCSASRSVILTGMQNHANGQYGHQHAHHHFHTFERIKSLPVLLSQAGYRTASIGKFHVQPESVYQFDKYLNQGIPGGSRNPLAMAENCRDFVAEASDKPFFLYFCTADPHRAGQGFANNRDYPGVEPNEYDPAKVIVPPFLPDNEDVRAELAEYYQAVDRLDQGITRLIEILKENGRYEDTLFIYISDNGIPFPGAKTNLYDAGMHLPMVVRSPDQETRGVSTNAMVTFADLVPTILDFAKAEGPDYPFQGRSFLSVLEQENPEGWDEVYASHTFHEITMYYPMRVVRNRKHKLIYNIAHPLPFPFASDLYESPTWQGILRRDDSMIGPRTVEAYIHRPRFELYDLEADPNEVVNLADDPAHSETLAQLQAKLKEFQEETGDPWILKYEYE